MNILNICRHYLAKINLSICLFAGLLAPHQWAYAKDDNGQYNLSYQSYVHGVTQDVLQATQGGKGTIIALLENGIFDDQSPCFKDDQGQSRLIVGPNLYYGINGNPGTNVTVGPDVYFDGPNFGLSDPNGDEAEHGSHTAKIMIADCYINDQDLYASSDNSNLVNAVASRYSQWFPDAFRASPGPDGIPRISLAGMAPEAKLYVVRTNYSDPLAEVLAMEHVIAAKKACSEPQEGVECVDIDVVHISTVLWQAHNMNGDTTFGKLIKEMIDAGIIVISIAGSNGPGSLTVAHPADLDYVLAAGSVKFQEISRGIRRAARSGAAANSYWPDGDPFVVFSSARGPNLSGHPGITVLANHQALTVTENNPDTNEGPKKIYNIGGSSFPGPRLAGAAALLKAWAKLNNVSLTQHDVMKAFAKGAVPLSSDNPDSELYTQEGEGPDLNVQGYGILNVAGALDALQSKDSDPTWHKPVMPKTALAESDKFVTSNVDVDGDGVIDGTYETFYRDILLMPHEVTKPILIKVTPDTQSLQVRLSRKLDANGLVDTTVDNVGILRVNYTELNGGLNFFGLSDQTIPQHLYNVLDGSGDVLNAKEKHLRSLASQYITIGLGNVLFTNSLLFGAFEPLGLDFEVFRKGGKKWNRIINTSPLPLDGRYCSSVLNVRLPEGTEEVAVRLDSAANYLQAPAHRALAAVCDSEDNCTYKDNYEAQTDDELSELINTFTLFHDLRVTSEQFTTDYYNRKYARVQVCFRRAPLFDGVASWNKLHKEKIKLYINFWPDPGFYENDDNSISDESSDNQSDDSSSD